MLCVKRNCTDVRVEPVKFPVKSPEQDSTEKLCKEET